MSLALEMFAIAPAYGPGKPHRAATPLARRQGALGARRVRGGRRRPMPSIVLTRAAWDGAAVRAAAAGRPAARPLGGDPVPPRRPPTARRRRSPFAPRPTRTMSRPDAGAHRPAGAIQRSRSRRSEAAARPRHRRRVRVLWRRRPRPSSWCRPWPRARSCQFLIARRADRRHRPGADAERRHPARRADAAAAERDARPHRRAPRLHHRLARQGRADLPLGAAVPGQRRRRARSRRRSRRPRHLDRAAGGRAASTPTGCRRCCIRASSPVTPRKPIASGLGVSPGAAHGGIVFTAEDAARCEGPRPPLHPRRHRDRPRRHRRHEGGDRHPHRPRRHDQPRRRHRPHHRQALRRRRAHPLRRSDRDDAARIGDVVLKRRRPHHHRWQRRQRLSRRAAAQPAAYRRRDGRAARLVRRDPPHRGAHQCRDRRGGAGPR